ncbi:TRAP transporter small permease subunit [Halomonas alkalicola]|uniref:TRAP transporter small permease subunit n=1 Tax=Halomonas alkalicola TaxID=1930622 RepID=UPI0035E55491
MPHNPGPGSTRLPDILPPEPSSNLPENYFSRLTDGAVVSISRVFSWLWVGTLLVVLSNVVGRFFLNSGSIAIEELAWHFFGAGMMLTMAYSVVTNEHVRVDVFFEKLSLKAQCWIELLLLVFLVFPILLIITVDLFEYAYRSWAQGERSVAASGLPYRFIIKTIIPAGLVLLTIALLSRASRLFTLVVGFPKRLL